VYYNLGNAYFKQGELAQSILAYERALRLKPSMKDAKHNLEFAQSRIIDNIEDTQSFFLSNWLKAIRNALSQSTWIALSISLFVLTLLGFFLFAFSSNIALRKTAFYISVVALVLSIAACANAGSLHQRDTQRAEAIIIQGVVNAKASPDRSGTELFTVHEGTKVEITEVIGDWCCIHVGNNVGWMPLAYLERI
jgi:tetratricopeptide (TPR) repeat protein